MKKIYVIEEEYQPGEALNSPFYYHEQYVESESEEKAIEVAKKNGHNKSSTYRVVKTKYILEK